MSVGETKAAILQSADVAENARTAVAAVLSQVDEAIARLVAATQGTNHAKIAEVMARYHAAKERLTEAAGLLGAGQGASQDYVSLI